MWLCTNRFGCAVKSGRADDRRCRDSGYEKRVPLMGDGRLRAQRHLVNRAGDSVPVVTGDPEHAQIAHGYEDRGQSQAQDRVNGTVESGSQAPRIVAEVRRAATEARAVSVATIIQGSWRISFVPGLPRFLALSRFSSGQWRDVRRLEILKGLGYRGYREDERSMHEFRIWNSMHFEFVFRVFFFFFLFLPRNRCMNGVFDDFKSRESN